MSLEHLLLHNVYLCQCVHIQTKFHCIHCPTNCPLRAQLFLYFWWHLDTNRKHDVGMCYLRIPPAYSASRLSVRHSLTNSWLNKETQPFPLPTSPLHTTGMVSVLIVCISLKTSGLSCISHQTTTSWSLLIIAFDSSRVINILLDTEWKCVFVFFLLKAFMAFHITCYAFISIPVMGCCFCLIQGCLL